MNKKELLKISDLMREAVSDPDDMVFLLRHMAFRFCPWKATYPGKEVEFAKFTKTCDHILKERGYNG